jgi:hypothetical protein
VQPHVPVVEVAAQALLVLAHPVEQDSPVQFLEPVQHMHLVEMVLLVVLVLEFILQPQELVVEVAQVHFRKVVEMELLFSVILVLSTFQHLQQVHLRLLL